VNASVLSRLNETVPSMMTNLEPIRFDDPAAVPAMEFVADWKNGLPTFKSSRMMLRELVKNQRLG